MQAAPVTLALTASNSVSAVPHKEGETSMADAHILKPGYFKIEMAHFFAAKTLYSMFTIKAPTYQPRKRYVIAFSLFKLLCM